MDSTESLVNSISCFDFSKLTTRDALQLYPVSIKVQDELEETSFSRGEN